MHYPPLHYLMGEYNMIYAGIEITTKAVITELMEGIREGVYEIPLNEITTEEEENNLRELINTLLSNYRTVIVEKQFNTITVDELEPYEKKHEIYRDYIYDILSAINEVFCKKMESAVQYNSMMGVQSSSL